MTMAMQAVQAPTGGPKVLRIGLIQSGKIVEERIVRTRETVSVGSSEKNHFIVHANDIPPRFDVFQLVGNDYILNFTDAMTGRVALPGGVQDLDTLRQTGGARNAGNYWQVKLNDNSRGKIVIGDVTLLFQFVAPPPVQPRPQLPAAVVGGFVKSIDWLFTSFVVFTFMLFFGFIIYLESADWPIDEGISEVPERYARLIFQEPPPPEPEAPPQEAEPTDEGEEEVEGEEVAEEAPTKQRDRGESTGNESSAPADGPARPSVAQNVQSQLQTLLFGSQGEGGGSAIDALTSGQVVGNTDDLLASTAGGVGQATGGSATLRTQGGGSGGSGQAGSLGALASSGGGGTKQASTGRREETGPTIRGNLNLGGGDEVGGTGFFDQGKVSSMIRRRQSAIKRCYEGRLRQNPTLSGKVVVEFSIQTSGRVSGASAAQNTTGDAQLASCVVGVIRRLRWNPGPEDGAVTYSYPFVFSPQN
jgi:TonB family protein